MSNFSRTLTSLALTGTALAGVAAPVAASEITGEVLDGDIRIYYLQCENRNDCDLYEVAANGMFSYETGESLSSLDREIIREGRSSGWTYRRTDVNNDACIVTVLDDGKLVNSGCRGI